MSEDGPEVSGEDIRNEGIGCALCENEEAITRLTIMTASGGGMVMSLGPNCRLLLEGTLRQSRKWEVRGGKLNGKMFRNGRLYQ